MNQSTQKFFKKPFAFRALCLAIACSSAAFVVACEPPPISSLSAEEGIARIQQSHRDERYDTVIAEVDEYRSRYPYSKFAAEAELLQADSYFQSGKYPEAISAYDSFLAKFPKHPQAPFAYFRTALCLDKQSPEAINREQRYSVKALESYASYLERYPDGKEADEAKERIKVLRERVAGHYLFIARFYWKKDLYHAALGRYLEILEKYPMYPEMKTEALQRSREAYEKLAEILEKDPQSDKLAAFRGETPASLRDKAKNVQVRTKPAQTEKEPEPDTAVPEAEDVSEDN